MTDEVRKLSFQGDATQLIRELTRMERKLLDNIDVAGKTDAQLRRTGRAIDESANGARKAAEGIQRLKTVMAQLEAENKAAGAAVEKTNRVLEKQSAKLAEAAALIQRYKQETKEMRAANTQLRTENEALVNKIDRLDAALEKTKGQFREFKASTKAAEDGLLQFGARATNTIGNLKKLEVQYDALRGAQLAQLQVQSRLNASQSAASFIRNPNTAAISNMGIGQLAQISRAYEVMGRTLQQDVERELTGRLAQRGFGMNAQQLEFSNALRYQLYDLVGIFGTVGVAATGLSVAFLNVGIQWEKNFANVERTSQLTGGAIEQLKQQFLDLQTLLPVTSEDLAKIGTLGAQMGVAAADLANFTQTTAQFSATAGISVDEAATALSRLDELLPDVEGNYVRLASAILKTGVNAVATEQQIVRGTNQIASMGQIAGMTTPEVVALASAMSSLGFSPELQRSIVTSSFSKIMLATAQVTEKTEAYGKVLNMTGKQFQEAWRSDALGTYRDLLEAIGNRGDAVTVLDDLGLASQRLTPNLLKLGQNVNVLDEALSDTREGWKEQTELQRQYGVISGTVAAKLQMLGQSWEAFLVSLNATEGPLAFIIDGISDLLNFLRKLSQDKTAATMVGIATAVGLVVGVLSIAVSAVALFTAGYIAMVNATVGLNTALALNTSQIDRNTIALKANETGTAANARARLGLGAPLQFTTEQTNKNNIALGVNNDRMRKGATGAIGFASKILGAIPAMVSWIGVITLATVGLAGLVSFIQNSGDIIYDFGKQINGIDTPKKAVEYNVENIKKAAEATERVRLAMRKMRDEGERGPGLNIDMSGRFKNVDFIELQARRSKEAWADLDSTIGELGSVEEKYAAINDAAERLGMSQEDLLKYLPATAEALGDGAAAAAKMQDEVEQLAQAQEIWAGMLGMSTDELKTMQGALKSAASSFFDFGGAITEALEKTKIENDNGELVPNPDFSVADAWREFTEGLSADLETYATFTDKLSELTVRGGTQLATEFAKMGPSSMDALTEALKMSPEQLAVVEGNMRLAAFYASDAYVDAFAQSNAILAAVLQATGDPAVVAQVSELLGRILKPGEKLTIEDIIAIETLAPGITIPAELEPTIDSEQLELQRLAASAVPIKMRAFVQGPNGEELRDITTEWRIEENGKSLIMPVDPNTETGIQILAAWRADQAKKKVTTVAEVLVATANGTMSTFRANNGKLYVDVVPIVSPAFNKLAPGAAIRRKDGGLLNGLGSYSNLPAFASGGQYGKFVGPGSGTSDSILAKVSNGEYIHTARAVRYYGTEFFDAINQLKFPRFAQGGSVGGVSVPSSGTPGTQVNVNVVQNNPVTRDPIRQLKEETEAIVAGIWI